MRLSNEQIERYYFDLFSRVYVLPAGTIEHSDKPDVILHGEKRIGIEITNFFLEDGSSSASEQVQSELREKVVADAQRIYEEREDGGTLHLTVGFDSAVPITNKRRSANQIADLATRIHGHRGQVKREAFENIPELDFAWAIEKRLDDPWRTIQVYSTPMMSLEKLRGIIGDKEEKSREYKSCDAYWLLIVVDFIDRAQDQEIQVEGFDSIISEVFEKVIVYKTAVQQVMEAGGAPSPN